jgi:ADP-heptose:LPS heptosyltransferase
MQKRRFDLALQMQGSGLLTNALASRFGARHTAGFYTPGRYRPNLRLFTPYPTGQPEIRIFLRLMEFLGLASQGEQLEFPVTGEEQQVFEAFRSTHALETGRYICLHPGARFPVRCLPPERFAEVGDALARLGYQIVVTGTAAERELTGAVVDNMRAPALDAAGLTNLGTLALLLSGSALLVCNDTGVSHIAAARQTPSVVLFTVSDPKRWRPLNHGLHRIIENAGQAPLEDILAQASLLIHTGTYANQPA